MAPAPQAPGSMPVSPYGSSMESNQTTNQDSPAMWITAVIVVGIVVLGGCIIFTVLYLHKRRQYRQARQRDPYLSRGEFTKKRSMSAVDLYNEEERQRKAMIRKSLVSRSTNSLETRSSRTNNRVERESFDMEEEEAVNMKDDWKEWEARVQRERALSLEQHPAVAQAPDLAIPQPTRSRSPSRSPLLGPLPPSPPPRHPSRLSVALT